MEQSVRQLLGANKRFEDKWKESLNSEEHVHHLAVQAYESENDFLQNLEGGRHFFRGIPILKD